MELIRKYIDYVRNVRRYSERTASLYEGVLNRYVRMVFPDGAPDESAFLESFNRFEVRGFMVALMENAAMQAVAAALPEGSATVGTQMNTSHIKASPLGATITASAVLTEVEGRKLTFAVKAWDDKGVIGEGEHTRFVVDRERFLSKL